MAKKNKVEIDVLVDDKGTTGKVGLGAKKAGDGLDAMAKGARNADRNTKGVAQASANGTKNFSKMAQGMGGLVGAYATFAASVFALSAAFNFLKNAADIQVLEQSQIQFAQNSGIAMQSLTGKLREASKGMLDFQTAASASAMGLAKGGSLKKMISEDVDCIIVAAGMEGALATLVSSMIDIPIIGIPISVGYGYGGKGITALASMLQSCSLGLSVVNIDNGIAAGGIAANIANRAVRKNQK